MNAATGCELIGRWRIVEADLWDRDYLDLVEPAYMTFAKNGRGEFAFGAINATMELRYGQRIVFFNWTGSTKATRPAAQVPPNLKTTAPSKSSYRSTTATTPSSKRAANDFFNSLLVTDKLLAKAWECRKKARPIKLA